jgi:hypothetical protein
MLLPMLLPILGVIAILAILVASLRCRSVKPQNQPQETAQPTRDWGAGSALPPDAFTF